ncbi:MAG: hypothetical protein EP329_24075 [Deltaproteobacteria bacterium]|nr:MAG: hypothetical protein EP329_24075 [Deltaproteobacteria bacterium]
MISVHRALLVLAMSASVLGCEAPSDDAATAEPPVVGKGDGPADGLGEAPSLYRAGNRYGWGGADPYLDEVQLVFARRCVNCHGCSDAPCQLKLTSYEAVVRGSNGDDLFGSRLMSIPASRMADGRITDSEGLIDFEATRASWRARGFYGVTEQGSASPMRRFIERARTNPDPHDLRTEYALFEDGPTDRKFACIGLRNAGPAGPSDALTEPRGMPFAVEPLANEDYERLAEWLDDGAYGPTREAQRVLARPADADVIARWEAFLNQEPAQAALAARYLYEHLFFAHLHFPEAPGEFYELVRSRTPAPAPIDEVVTFHANQDPAGERIYYRLRKYTAVVMQKNHIPWLLDDATLDRWQELFLDTDWGVDVRAPGYGNANPFAYFEQIPARIRNRFMLENSRHFIEAMVKGDVCVGSSATYAIRDRFWIWFYDPGSDVYPAPWAPTPGGFDPGSDPSAIDPYLGQDDLDHVDPSVAKESREEVHVLAFNDALRAMHPAGLALEDLWYGDREDKDAWLTVLRHGESATVHQGGIAGLPETIWVLSYANFERLYYSLVVNFQPWGNVAHKLDTWQMMSFVRSSAEDQFLMFMPPEMREYYRGLWVGAFSQGVQRLFPSADLPSQVPFPGGVDPLSNIGQLVTARMPYLLGSVNPRLNPLDPPYALSEPVDDLPSAERALSMLTGFRGGHAAYLPDVTVLRVGGTSVYTLLANRAYDAHNRTFLQKLARTPELDTMSVERGLVGSYPNLFIDVPLHRVYTLVTELQTVYDKKSFRHFVDRNTGGDGVREIRVILRDDPAFWPFVDWLHTWNLAANGQEAGLLDLVGYFWRESLD